MSAGACRYGCGHSTEQLAATNRPLASCWRAVSRSRRASTPPMLFYVNRTRALLIVQPIVALLIGLVELLTKP